MYGRQLTAQQKDERWGFTLLVSVKHLGYFSKALNTSMHSPISSPDPPSTLWRRSGNESMHPPAYSCPLLSHSALYLPQLAAGKGASCDNHMTVTWPLCTIMYNDILTSILFSSFKLGTRLKKNTNISSQVIRMTSSQVTHMTHMTSSHMTSSQVTHMTKLVFHSKTVTSSPGLS